jgi:formylglycine-generating enzyme required for sulfatase activity
VVHVSWNDAAAFCRWLGETEGRTYRLPTDAEWEFACRAGSDGLYGSGDDPFERPKYVVSGRTGPAAVGTKRANRFGLFDMEGNVWEWCADWWAGYSTSAETDPRGPPDGTFRVQRGGGYGNAEWGCRCGLRSYDAPGERFSDTGFRVVLDVKPK